MSKAFVIDRQDNVATAMDDLVAGQGVEVFGDCGLGSIDVPADVRSEHKIALAAISKGQAIVKYGRPIGIASKNIVAGEWVHLHNCESQYDERSGSLDGDSGAPTDIEYV